MQRQLASVSTQAFFLGGHDIIRENDLVTYLCVVHRGKVVLTKKNRKLIVLTKVLRLICFTYNMYSYCIGIYGSIEEEEEEEVIATK